MKAQRHNLNLGKLGESSAARYLADHGYKILARNFKIRDGELDIVCLKGPVAVFVEVKTRIGEAFGKPEESVTPRKLRQVIKAAEYFMLTHKGLPAAMRIDVIAIEFDARGKPCYFRHIENVTV